MLRCYAAVGLLISTTVCGCSTFDCCNWWGRNSDGSNNLARNKPVPYQSGPIAGTYNSTAGGQGMPSASNTIVQPPSTMAVKPPMVTTSPAQAAPVSTEQPGSTLTPPAPPSQSLNIVPSQYQTPAVPTDILRMPLQQASERPAATKGSFATTQPMPDNQPSIPMPQVAEPQVKGPTLDLTLPGSSAAMPSNMNSAPPPLILALPAAPGRIANDMQSMTIKPPAVEFPTIAQPMNDTPLNIAPPRMATMPGKPTTMNPGTMPPPLPAPPSVPSLELR